VCDGIREVAWERWYAYFDVYVDGRRRQQSTSFGRDKRAAEDFALLKER
jgi:hypothetical protein